MNNDGILQRFETFLVNVFTSRTLEHNKLDFICLLYNIARLESSTKIFYRNEFYFTDFIDV